MSLRSVIETTSQECGCNLGDLSVLSTAKDPYWKDTPANRKKAKWLVRQMEMVGLLTNDTPIHNRGAFYAIMSHAETVDLKGAKYVNSAENWSALEEASSAARWLGYLPWDKIFDARNEDPVIRFASEPDPSFSLKANAYLLPDPSDFFPTIDLNDFRQRQPYRIAIYGEKTSLANVLSPISERFNTDLYLPSGEISNTQVARMARAAAADGRPLVVLIFADCDPAGYQMAVSIGHKLRAMRDSRYPDLTFELYAPALTVEQVRSLGLPSTPLKETERRASGWRARYGVEQTEIDALATLQPDVLTEIAETAIAPFYDADLANRVARARADWLSDATEQLVASVGGEQYLAERNARIRDILNDLQIENDAMAEILKRAPLDLPPMNIPEPNLSGRIKPKPITSSALSFLDHVRILRDRKDYSGGAA